MFSIYFVVLTTEFRATKSSATLSFGDHYSETRSATSLALGDDGRVPLAVPPGPVFDADAGGIAVRDYLLIVEC